MIEFLSFDDIEEGDTYQNTQNHSIWYCKKFGNVWYHVPEIENPPHSYKYPIKLNNAYILKYIGNINFTIKKRIDPRIIKARKEWGMEANPIFK